MDETRTNQALHDLARLYLTAPEDSSHDPAPAHDAPKHGMTPSSAACPEPGRRADRDPTSPDAALAPRALLVGHLPGFANLWINQYAQQLSETLGPVGVVHVGAGQIDVDLFHPGLPTPTGSTDDAPAPGTLTEAIDAAGNVRQWLVHLIDPTRDDMRSLAGQLRRWTLLSGADEAAIVAAYQLLKQWIEPAGYAAGDPAIELAFLGCEPSAAEHAADRIRKTAGQFLDVGLTVGPVQPKMQPVNRRRLGSFDPPEPLSDLLDLLFIDPPYPLHLADDNEAQADPPAHAEASSKSGMTPSSAADRDPPPDAPAPPHEPPKHGMTPSSAADRDPPSPLADHVAGLTPLAARCPRGEAVELAVDNAGRLHLLLDASATDDPLALLMRVGAWAAEHATLLAMTVPDRRVDPDAPAAWHLFTAEPKKYIEHARAVRLHLLLPAGAGGATAPIHVELS